MCLNCDCSNPFSFRDMKFFRILTKTQYFEFPRNGVFYDFVKSKIVLARSYIQMYISIRTYTLTRLHMKRIYAERRFLINFFFFKYDCSNPFSLRLWKYFFESFQKIFQKITKIQTQCCGAVMVVPINASGFYCSNISGFPEHIEVFLN